MTTHADLLDLPAPTAARWLALRWLRKAEDAHRRLGAADDASAVHDFRVALRRLHSTLRGFDAVLPRVARRKERARLRALRDATGDVRDLQVQLHWLRDLPAEADAVEQAGREWMMERGERELRRAEGHLGETTDRHFRRLRKRLSSRLERYTVDVAGAAPPRPVSMADALADVATGLGGDLRWRLEAIRAAGDLEEAHRARIAGKRLRYVLEPFVGEVVGLDALVERLRGLQHLLGDVRDGEILQRAVGAEIDALEEGEALRRAGLLALLQRIRLRLEAAFGDLEREWLGEAPAPFFTALGAVAAELGARGRAGVEIERKYLLRALPDLPAGAERLEIEQGWLPGERLLERLRRVRSDGGDRFFRTVKLGAGVRRIEIEEEVPAELFAALWSVTDGRRVRKVRHRVPHAGLVWEIDHFSDRDLVLAEVELPRDDADPDVPPWLLPVLVRDVTGEAEFVNVNLAR